MFPHILITIIIIVIVITNIIFLLLFISIFPQKRTHIKTHSTEIRNISGFIWFVHSVYGVTDWEYTINCMEAA